MGENEISIDIKKLIVICIATTSFWTAQVYAEDASQTPSEVSTKSVGVISPSYVLTRTGLLRDELELIRYEMGKTKNMQAEIKVSNAAPHEVFFQALTLFHKTNRLAFEQTKTLEEEIKLSTAANIKPEHVLKMVNAALDRVLIVKKKLDITEAIEEKTYDNTITPTDVFRSIVQANRQLNLMLSQQFAPSDVFQQVSLSINYTARLLARFPEATRIPDYPAYERGKHPSDVYQRLIDCYDLIQKIAKTSDLDMLNLTVDTDNLTEKVPSDVYDIASLIVSELAYIHSNLDNAQPPAGVYYPGNKFPSHVFQRAGILERQLTGLLRQVESNPKWLK